MKKLISYHIIFCLLAQLVVIPAQAGISYQQKADELLPVDCMLPGVVRKLGNRMTYLTPRRPSKQRALTAKSEAASMFFTIEQTIKQRCRSGYL